LQGLQGNQGPQGFQGTQGNTGLIGPTGPILPDYLAVASISNAGRTGPAGNTGLYTSSDTYFDVYFDYVSGPINGWTLAPAGAGPYSEFITPATGIYSISYSATVVNRSLLATFEEDVLFTLAIRTGVDTLVPMTQRWTTVPGDAGIIGTESYADVSLTTLVSLTVGQVLVLRTAASGQSPLYPTTHLAIPTDIDSLGALGVPLPPDSFSGVSLTITRIA